MNTDLSESISFGGIDFAISRPHRFGLVVERPINLDSEGSNDYLHQVLLSKPNRDAFFELVEKERLVVCKNVSSESQSYRKVRGKSSMGRLSQAEYFHHDGCSCPQKPRINEIRLPSKSMHRDVATAIAPFGDVVAAQLKALPARLICDETIAEYRESFSSGSKRPPIELWDRIQGRITRLVRREMDAESAREYFRQVDQISGAYDFAWESGESRFMLNDHVDLTKTMQHRRAYKKPKVADEQNGSLVKRWTAEEV